MRQTTATSMQMNNLQTNKAPAKELHKTSLQKNEAFNLQTKEQTKSYRSIQKDQRRPFEFEIAGLPYKLKSSHDEQTVKQLVQFVESKVKEALAVTKSGSLQSAAVLAALNIAEELILLKRKAKQELEILEDKALKLAGSIEQSKIPKQGKGL